MRLYAIKCGLGLFYPKAQSIKDNGSDITFEGDAAKPLLIGAPFGLFGISRFGVFGIDVSMVKKK